MAEQIETEVKYRVENPSEKEKILSQYEKLETIEQTDYYFNPPGRDFAEDRTHYLRIRVDGESSSFDFHIVKNDEETREFETGIGSPEQLKNMLEQLGFENYVKVVKKRKIFAVKDFEVTVDRINDVGGFVEIETTANNPDRQLMDDIAEDLDLKSSNKVSGKGYPDIVMEEKN